MNFYNLIEEAVPEDDYKEFRKKLAKDLVPFYEKYPLAIATLCDEYLDRSGNMLGWIRDHEFEKILVKVTKAQTSD